MSYKLSQRAEKDIISIAKYSLQQWGKAAAKRYVTSLHACFELLSSNPRLGRPRDVIKSGYLSINEGSHVVFYKINDDNDVIIIRVLHQRMDFTRHL